MKSHPMLGAAMTRSATVRLLTAIVTGLVLVAGAAACNRSPSAGPTTTETTSPTPTASVSPSASASPSPTPPATDPAIVFAADGIGPYVIGSEMSDLKARAVLANIVESPFCTDAFGAEGTGAYAKKITLTFRHGLLAAIHTTSNTYVTPSGARVGMSLSQVQGIYGSRATLLTGTLGNKALSVRVPASGLAIIFYVGSSGTTIDAMSGGEAQPLEDAVHNGEGC
jgi:hypothetical protein